MIKLIHLLPQILCVLWEEEEGKKTRAKTSHINAITVNHWHYQCDEWRYIAHLEQGVKFDIFKQNDNNNNHNKSNIIKKIPNWLKSYKSKVLKFTIQPHIIQWQNSNNVQTSMVVKWERVCVFDCVCASIHTHIQKKV